MSDIILKDNERVDKINADLSLIQKNNGLTFGTDAYLLSAFSKKAKRMADLGSGTGVASFLNMAHRKADAVTAFEIQSDFCDLINRNAELNNLSDKITVINSDIRDISDSSLFEKFDVVISNPPYMKECCGEHNAYSEMDIARREIHGTITDFCSTASKLLKFGGYFYVVYIPDRMCDLICSMREARLEPKRIITVYPRQNSSPNLILIEAKKGAGSSLSFSRPLIIYNKENQYTDDMQKIYDDFDTSHLFEKI